MHAPSACARLTRAVVVLAMAGMEIAALVACGDAEPADPPRPRATASRQDDVAPEQAASERARAASRESVRAVLLPIEAATVAREEAAARGGDDPLVGRPLAGRLFEAFVIDEPDRIVHVSTEQLAELGAPTIDELHELALANMRRAFSEELHHEPFSHRAPDVRIVTTGDSYANSRVLLHERWAPIARQVRGDLLVAAPARDAVVFTGSASERDVAALRWLAQQMVQNEPHPIAPAVLRWTPERWELFHANETPDSEIDDLLRRSP